ncbi:MAG TPA: citrate/2-methylcitrate synthase [archaeon]|nr:citrate/2-methylcitrate synthase [archaeon]
MVGKISMGMAGVTVSESTICDVQGLKGRLVYRGYDIEDLAENSSFEEVIYLLLYGELPTEKEFQGFKKKLHAFMHLQPKAEQGMKLLNPSTTPMEALRTTVSALSSGIPDARSVPLDVNLNVGLSLVAKFPVIVANYYRIKHKKSLVKPNPKLGYAENFLWMLHGKKPTPVQSKSMDLDLILHAEHSFNASTFAARVAASTMSDIYSAIVAAICTLRGPLHGGAAREVYLMLQEIHDAKNVEEYVSGKLERHEKIMGFGHRVYKTYDPRARVLKKMADELCDKAGNRRYYEVADKVEEVMVREKDLYPNVDFYSSIVYHSLGLPLELDTPIFAIGRSPGWVAHVLEQYKENKLIRPLAEYVGPVGLKYAPLDRRK